MAKHKADDGVVLTFVGGEVNNIPARDLTADDLERLGHDTWVNRRLAPDPESLFDALLASGVYQAPKPAKE